MQNYISSIITNYGDVASVKDDVETLNEILSRQGNQLLIDVISERAGNVSVQFSLSAIERERLITSLTSALREALLERI